jgi:arylsulfatase A-like enzyme
MSTPHLLIGFTVLLSSGLGCGGSEAPSAAAPAVAPPRAALTQDRAPATPAATAVEARHVVIILVDTLRADVLEQAQTPRIDALAAEGLVVERAWSTTTWTVPAVVSLFTGSFLRTHGWDLPTGDMTKRPPLPDLPTLAEVLGGAGFATHGLYANGYLAHELGFSRGFDEWKRCPDSRMALEVQRRVADWTSLDPERDPAQRRFLYLHLLGVHSGLKPSAEAVARHRMDEAWFAERVGLLIGRAKRGQEPGVEDAYRLAYRGVVEDMDARVGEILDALAPVRDETLVVLLSDHGEELGERGSFGHGWSVAEALTHVPMMVSGPGVAPERRPTATIAELPDLITDAVGIEHPWPVQSPWEGPLVAERHGKQAVLVGARYKGEWHGGELTTYDLTVDAAGLQPVSGGEEQIQRGLERWKAETPLGEISSGHVELDPRTLEAVQALGYID